MRPYFQNNTTSGLN